MDCDSYNNFKKDVITNSRTFLNDDAMAFLNFLYTSAIELGLVEDLHDEYLFFRARKGYQECIEDDEYYDIKLKPYDYDGIIPKPEFTKKGGRANPAGIPYLYLSTSPEGAVAEIRPDINNYVTVAQFKPKKTGMKILNTTKYYKPKAILLPFVENPSQDEVTEYLWSEVAEAFSKPVLKDESDLQYIPTQIISDFFKSKDVNGIGYISQFDARKPDKTHKHEETGKIIYSTSESHKYMANAVFFNVDDFKMVDSFIYRSVHQILLVEKLHDHEVCSS